MKYEIEKLPKKTYKIKITIEAEKVKEAHGRVVEEAVKNSEIKGFRKGQAPREMVEPTLNRAKLRGEVINHLVPKAYDQTVKEALLKPILLPKIEIVQFEEGKDLVFTATTCEAPEIKLGNYKGRISEITTATSESKIILGPDGQPIREGSTKPAAANKEDEKISQVLDALLESSTAEISDLLIDEEVNHMLSRLVDQTGRLGLTVDAYLTSIGKDARALRADYHQTAERTLKLEFLLTAVAQKEELKVEESEISATINAAPDEPSRQSLSKPGNRAYIKGVLLKNKTIQKLLEQAN